MKKSQFNTALKELGLGFVKMELNSFQSKTFKNFDGKMVKGLQGASIGPMTSTSAYINQNSQVENQVVEKIGRQYVKNWNPGLFIEFEIENKSIRLSWNLYRTYAHNDYDASYKTYWLSVSN